MQARHGEGAGEEVREGRTDIVQNMASFPWADNQNFSTPVKQMEGGHFMQLIDRREGKICRKLLKFL